ENPYCTQPRAAQLRFSVIAWVGPLGDYLTGLYLLPSPVEGRANLIFLQQAMSELLYAADVPSSLPLDSGG
ncbi:hypothetical protein TNCT_102201, partial [Trichonephila clavata]